MKKVSMDGLPTTEAVVEELNLECDNKKKMKDYLGLLHEEYSSKIGDRLYAISLDNINQPDFFDIKKAHRWYGYYVRNPKKKLFSQFPEVTNLEERPICPFCEGALSTKVTLEHVTPKNEGLGEYRLSILPINLIKCCPECNTNKHCRKSKNKEESEINLYFESYPIEKFIEVNFNNSEYKLVPEIHFNYNESVTDKRVKNFINNYNIQESYNFRLQMEFKKILTVISSNLVNLTPPLLLKFIDNQRQSYSSNIDSQKIDDNIWIDQSFFGFLICEKLLQINETDKPVFDKFISEIEERKKRPMEIALSNKLFFEELELIANEHELADFLTSNEVDIRNYYFHQKRYHRLFEFPNLYISENTAKKKAIEAILIYYIESEKDFSTFENSCKGIFY